jgi:hypothetical protein
MEYITAFVSSKFAAPAGIMLAVYLLGMFSKSKAYTAIRAAIGKASFSAGDFVSSFATSKVGKVVWGPLEAIFIDFIFVFFEQFSAGLRNDNVEKLEAQTKRLKDVGSIFRLEAVEGKLDIMSDPNDRLLHANLLKKIKESAREKLKE